MTLVELGMESSPGYVRLTYVYETSRMRPMTSGKTGLHTRRRASCSPPIVRMEPDPNDLHRSDRPLLKARTTLIVRCSGATLDGNDTKAKSTRRLHRLHEMGDIVTTSVNRSCSQSQKDRGLVASTYSRHSSTRYQGLHRCLPGSSTNYRILDVLFRVAAVLVCLGARAMGLVIEEPFQEIFIHV